MVEDWDRRLTSAYLQTLFQEGLLEGNPLFPQFDFRPPGTSMNHKQVPPALHPGPWSSLLSSQCPIFADPSPAQSVSRLVVVQKFHLQGWPSIYICLWTYLIINEIASKTRSGSSSRAFGLQRSIASSSAVSFAGEASKPNELCCCRRWSMWRRLFPRRHPMPLVCMRMRASASACERQNALQSSSTACSLGGLVAVLVLP